MLPLLTRLTPSALPPSIVRQLVVCAVRKESPERVADIAESFPSELSARRAQERGNHDDPIGRTETCPLVRRADAAGLPARGLAGAAGTVLTAVARAQGGGRCAQRHGHELRDAVPARRAQPARHMGHE